MPRARLINTYDVVIFANLLSTCGYRRSDVDRVLEAHGSFDAEGIWVGGFLIKKPQGELEYLTISRDSGPRRERGTHILDFPTLPEKTDNDPFVLNEWLKEESE